MTDNILPNIYIPNIDLQSCVYFTLRLDLMFDSPEITYINYDKYCFISFIWSLVIITL